MYSNSTNKYYSEWTISLKDGDEYYFDNEKEATKTFSKIKKNLIQQFFRKDYEFYNNNWEEIYCKILYDERIN